MTSTEVCIAAGISYRRLDYWARQGYVQASGTPKLPGSGNERSWTEKDLERVIEVRETFERCIAILKAAGLAIPAGWSRRGMRFGVVDRMTGV